MENINLRNGYYKIDLYNSTGEQISEDSEKRDYIIVEVKDNKVREVVSNKIVTYAYYNEELGENAFDEEQYSKIKQDQYLLGIAPYIRLNDLKEEKEIHYNGKLGYNPELTDYISCLNDRFFTIYLNEKENRINENRQNAK